jgi:hypothetical protein
MLVDEVDNLLFGYQLTIDADTLAQVVQVGRGEETGAIARLLQHGSDNVGYGAFAIGSRYVNGEEVALRIAQVSAESSDTFQSRFIGIDSSILE